MPTSGPTPLGRLLSESWSFCTTYWKPIVTAAVVLGIVSAIAYAAIGVKALDNGNMMMDQMGIDAERMQQLGERMQAGDATAEAEIEALVNNAFGENGERATLNTAYVFRAFGPLIGLGVIVAILITVASAAYYLVLALQPTQDAMAPAKRVPGLFLPLLGLWLWVFIRTFAWIPVIGVVTAIILGPRFVLAPVVMLQEKKGILQSASDSYRRTQGYWGKIFGNAIVAALCIFVAGLAIGIVAGIAGAMNEFAGLLIKEIGKYVTSAFMTVFMVKLALTIMANPFAVAKK